MINRQISVILPVYNEAQNIEGVISDICSTLPAITDAFEIVMVNDGSRDATAGILENISSGKSYIKVITHQKNFGYGVSIMSGVANSRYPLVFSMDADGQFDIKELKKALCYLKDFDIVIGYRANRADSFYRIILATGYSWLVFLFFGLRFKDVNCGFKLLKKSVFDQGNISTAGVFYTEVLLKAKKRGFRIKEIPVTHLPRLRGRQTGGSPGVMFGAIVDLFRLKRALIREKAKNS
jgi:glycosyltransferase involved in cell wall biosynthesis